MANLVKRIITSLNSHVVNLNDVKAWNDEIQKIENGKMIHSLSEMQRGEYEKLKNKSIKSKEPEKVNHDNKKPWDNLKATYSIYRKHLKLIRITTKILDDAFKPMADAIVKIRQIKQVQNQHKQKAEAE